MPFDGPSHVLITIEPQHGKRQDKKGVSQRADISSFAKYRKPKKTSEKKCFFKKFTVAQDRRGNYN